MDRDRNLLYGVLAVQLKKLTPADFVELAGEWANDPTVDIAERLAEAGYLTREERRVLNELVLKALREHGGSASATLRAFQDDPDLCNSLLDTLPAPPRRVNDPDASPRPVWTWQPGATGEMPELGVQETPGRYRLIRERYVGGMGRILQVNDHFLARDIVLKELLPEPQATGQGPDGDHRFSIPLASRFFQEAQITSQLEHPAIVPIYELGRRMDGTLYYTMKMVRGRTLAAAVQQAKGLSERLRLLPHFMDLCQAIAYAHSRGVIHRDIKPENVMVGEFGETVVIDWGLAKAVGQSDMHEHELERALAHLTLTENAGTVTQAGAIVGTPSYMSPEQAQGRIDAIDARSDVYGLGAVLYTLLTGKPPHIGESVREILGKVVQETPHPVEQCVPEVPRDLVAICNRALSKDASARYQTARDLVDDVQRFQAGALVDAYEYGLLERIHRVYYRYRALSITGAVALAVILILAFFYNVRLIEARDQERYQRELAVEALKKQEEHSRQAVAEKVRAERENYYASLALAKQHIDGLHFEEARALLNTCPTEYRNFEWGLLQHLSNLGLVTLQGHAGAVRAVAIVPGTDERLLSAGDDGAVMAWNLSRGEMIYAAPLSKTPLLALAVSADGKWCAVAGADGLVRIIETADGRQVGEFKASSKGITSLAWYPAGGLLATAGMDDTVGLWTVPDGIPQLKLAGHLNDVCDVAFSPDGRYLVTGSRDDTAILWDASTGALLHRMSAHQNDVTAVAFSGDGESVATGSLDGQIALWRVDDAILRGSVYEAGGINTLFFSPGDKTLVAATTENRAAVWDLQRRERIRSLEGHNRSVADAVFAPDHQLLITASEDETLKVWDVEQDPHLVRMRIALEAPHYAKFAVSSHGNRVAAAGNYGAAVVWDFARDALVGQIACDIVDAMELSADGARLLTLRANGTVGIWDTDTQTQLFRMQDPTLYLAALSPDGARVALGYRDGMAKLRSVSEDRDLMRFEGDPGPVSGFAFHPLGNVVATGGRSGTVFVWNSDTGSLLGKFSVDGPIRALSFGNSGTRLAVIADVASLWDWETADKLFAVDHQSGQIDVLAFSPDDRRLATGNSDGSIRLCDTANGRELLTIEGAAGSIHGLAFSKGGQSLTAVGQGQKASDTLARWDLPPWVIAAQQAEGAALAVQLEKTKQEHWWRSREAPAPGAQLITAVRAIAGQMPGTETAPARVERPVEPEQFEQFLTIARDLLKTNRDTRGYLGKPFVSDGLYLEPQAQMLVFSRLGFEPGDILRSINGTPLTSYDAAIEAIKRIDINGADTVEIELWRDGAVLTFEFRRMDMKAG
jgi:WD40 repeat protein/serine/threonine protein kinase